MKATEIQIYDWLNTEIDGQIVAKQVKRLTTEDVQGEPIPITEEFLLENNFEYEDETAGIGDDVVLWSLSRNGWFITWWNGHLDKERNFIEDPKMSAQQIGHVDTIFALPCPYVHTLQHALRLIGLNDIADGFQMFD